MTAETEKVGVPKDRTFVNFKNDFGMSTWGCGGAPLAASAGKVPPLTHRHNTKVPHPKHRRNPPHTGACHIGLRALHGFACI